MAELLTKFLNDPNAMISLASLTVAVVCARIAIKEARLKERQSALRERDLSTFVQALEQIMRDHERAPELIRRITGQTKELIETSTVETKKAIAELANASKTLEEVFASLRQVTNVALRSQRDSAKAHRELMSVISSKVPSELSPPPSTPERLERSREPGHS